MISDEEADGCLKATERADPDMSGGPSSEAALMRMARQTLPRHTR